MTPEEKKARELVNPLLLKDAWGYQIVEIDQEVIEKIISDALKEAYNDGLERGAVITKNIPSISLGGTTYEILSQVEAAIRKEMKRNEVFISS